MSEHQIKDLRPNDMAESIRERTSRLIKKIEETYSGENLTMIQRKLEYVPQKLKNTYLAALTKGVSPQTAIRLQCLECNGWSMNNDDIIECPSVGCPLYRYRPYQEK